MNKLIVAIGCFGVIMGATAPVQARAVTIKFATLAPEGTTWVEVLRAARNEIKDKTKGNVDFKIYPGGIAGDEPDVLLKMKLGQYHAAGFTGVGLGEIVPDVRILELPFFYRDLGELDFVREKLTAELAAKFLAKGQVFLGWAEPGLVYFFAQKPVQNADDMRGVKLWAWQGDPLAAALTKALLLTPVNIALPDVLMALQTGMINAVYAPPLAAMALQWHTKVKFMIKEPLANSTGAVLVAKKMWDEIAAEDQTVVKQTIGVALGQLTAKTRQQNNDAIEEFKRLGIKVAPLSDGGRQEIVRLAAEVRPSLVGKLYNAELLAKVEAFLTEYRAAPTSKKKI